MASVDGFAIHTSRAPKRTESSLFEELLHCSQSVRHHPRGPRASNSNTPTPHLDDSWVPHLSLWRTRQVGVILSTMLRPPYIKIEADIVGMKQ